MTHLRRSNRVRTVREDDDFINWAMFEDLDQSYRTEHQHIVNVIGNRDINQEEDEEQPNRIFNKLKERQNGLYTCTNFTEVEINGMWLDMQEEIATHGTRGPKPKITMLDSFILLLMLYKHGMDYDTLAFNVKQPKSTVESETN